MRNIIPKTIDSYKKNGLARTIKKILHFLKPYEYRGEILMLHKRITPVGSAFSDGLDIRVASAIDIDESYKDIWHTKKEALEELKNGHTLFLAKDGAVNTLYFWIHLSSANIPWLWIRDLALPEKVVYLATVYVPLEYRGHQIAKRSLRFIENYLLEKTSTEKAFVIIATDNTASLNLFSSFDYSPYQKVRFFKIKYVQLYVYVVKPQEKGRANRWNIYIQRHDFWNVFSNILKN